MGLATDSLRRNTILASSAFLLSMGACAPKDDKPFPETDEPPVDTPEVCPEIVELTSDNADGGITLEAFGCYEINSQMKLTDGTLTIEEGVTLSFAENVGLEVEPGAYLNVQGSEEAPVLFQPQVNGATWQGIMVESGSDENQLSHVVIDGAGSDAWNGNSETKIALFFEDDSKMSLDHVHITNSDYYGFWISDDAEVTMSNSVVSESERIGIMDPNMVQFIHDSNTFSGQNNQEEFVRLVHSNTQGVEEDQTWPMIDVPWFVTERFFVDAELVLPAGSHFLFDESAYLTVRHTLMADGTQDAPIRFEGRVAGAGVWRGLRFEGAGNQLTHVVIDGAGSEGHSGDGDSVAAIYVNADTRLEVDGLAISNSGRHGVYFTFDSDPGVALTCVSPIDWDSAEGNKLSDKDGESVPVPGC